MAFVASTPLVLRPRTHPQPPPRTRRRPRPASRTRACAAATEGALAAAAAKQAELLSHGRESVSTAREESNPSSSSYSSTSASKTATTATPPPPLRARLHRTGTPLLLRPSLASTPPHTRRYINCLGCNTAYVGNTIVRETSVKCPVCSQTFRASPEKLFVAVDASAVAAEVAAAATAKAKASARRGDILCPHFRECPGCTLDEKVFRPAIADEADMFSRNVLGRSERLHVEMGPAEGWRTHAKLAVRPAGIGLFRGASHDIVEIPRCAVHHPAINAAAAALEAAMNKTSARAYDEKRQAGRVRYALFTVERGTGKVQVTIVWNASDWKGANPGAPRLGAELWAKNRELLHSVWFNWNTSSGNAITSQKEDGYYLMHGPALIRETVAGASVYFAPTVFRQANLDAFERLIIPQIISYIPKRSTVVELYGGVGVIALAALAKQSELQLKSVTVTEINPFAAAPFRKSLEKLDPMTRRRVRYVVGSDDETVSEAVNGDANVLIVDPPRAGVAEQCMEALVDAPKNGSRLERLIYVSCGFDAFRRDARKLMAGSWGLTDMRAYVLFPGSNHIETFAVFDRKSR